MGQGDATVLAAGGDSAVVVDAGPDPVPVDRCLRELGVRRVPLLVLTHFHADHVAGLPGVLRGRSVGAIQTTGLAAPPGQAAFVRRTAAAAGVPLIRAVPGERRRIGALEWRVLWPWGGGGESVPSGLPRISRESMVAGQPVVTRQSMVAGQPVVTREAVVAGQPVVARESAVVRESVAAEVGGGANDASVTLLVRTAGGVSLLLLGDLEPPAQRALSRLHPGLGPVDVLKVAHHGSAYQDPGLMRAVRPRLALVSTGRDNPYGHPSARTLEALRAGGARVLRTDRDGAIAVVGTGRGLVAVPGGG